MVLSAFFFAITDTLIKHMSPTTGTIQIAFVRFFLGVLILLPMMLARGEPIKGSLIRVLLVRGITGTLAFLCLLQWRCVRLREDVSNGLAKSPAPVSWVG